MREVRKLSIIILCGGKGERLYPLTDNVPKPMVKIQNRPILTHLFDYLVEHNLEVDGYFLATGYQAEIIQDYVQIALQKRVSSPIHCFNAGDVDIIKRIQQILNVTTGDFMVFYGDTLSDISLNSLVSWQRKSPLKAVVSVWPLRSPFGVFEVKEEGRITKFCEKPIISEKWINIGHFYFPGELRPVFFRHNNFEALLQDLVDKDQIRAFCHKGIHITVNTHKELAEAERNISLLSYAKKDISSEQSLDL